MGPQPTEGVLKMANHSWVSMTYIPLDVEKRDDGSIHVSATESAIEIAGDEALMGCFHCHTPLDTDTFDRECPGPAIIQQ